MQRYATNGSEFIKWPPIQNHPHLSPPLTPFIFFVECVCMCGGGGGVLYHYWLMSRAEEYTFSCHMMRAHWHHIPHQARAALTPPAHESVYWTVCACVLMCALLFCPSITSLVKADRAVRVFWQEGQQTGVSVLAAHPLLASAAKQPSRLHPHTITYYNPMEREIEETSGQRGQVRERDRRAVHILWELMYCTM